MFESLSEKLSGILDKLTGRGALSEEDVNAAMREVRRALLEADVALEVVRSFIDRTRTKAIGAAVVKSIKPGQMVVKIVHDSLIETLGGESQTIDLNAPAPVGDHAGRPAGRRQDDHHRQDRQAPDRAQEAPGADGLARRQAPGRAGTACRARASGRRRTLPIVPGQDPVAIARRAESARACKATTSCCSTRPAAPTSTSR